MEIVSRKKNNYGKTVSFTDVKVKMNFDINILDLMCAYLVSENANIKNSHLINMRNLFETLDLSVYENDIEKMKRVRFIRKGLEARLLENLRNPSLILAYINGGIVDGDLDLESFIELSTSELTYINETISGALRCTFIENDMDRILDIVTRYKAQDYRYRDTIIKEYEEFIKESNNKFRRVKADTLNNTVFTLEREKFENIISDIHDKLSSPSRGLKCGMQGLNEMLGGWFESTRFYLMVGLAGCGKSMVLLNLALQIKNANKGYRPKDLTKIPTILLLTQENDVDETVDRICSILTGSKMSNFTKEDILNILKNKGELTLSGDNNINIHIIYKPNKAIDTGDLYTIVEDLEDDGYEVILLIQDHIKRIRSVFRNQELRLELGDIVNEIKVFAQLKQIPVISVSHLNRDASKTIDDGVRSNKADLTRLLGRSNVGESMLMIDNADWAAIINDEYDHEGNKYMAFKNIKMRYAGLSRDCIYQPFENGNSIKLIEDLYSLVPVFKDTLSTQQPVPTAQLNRSVNMKPSMYNNIHSLEDDDDNIFIPTGSCYSSDIQINNVAPISTPRTIIPLSTVKSGKAIPLVFFYENEEDYAIN